ncbi:uncharacterized protein Z518_01651 [Rhinocladiella mackenziei CBS 650.93]|uniref:Uncharacterized protein n=1 Tax=Rhinocladiella mackenziei CBS 650.93 TaxID=1442369 RepID=A0A0D2G6I8_9EURO|nr:uncharacterized protein Z518_01651 [Rhinocladiella mackenziei CBS 650.93]KIX10567.1 hypothetical protein Z518_01651 [Rhinocladiella mackenziei CBS 650.93]
MVGKAKSVELYHPEPVPLKRDSRKSLFRPSWITIPTTDSSERLLPESCGKPGSKPRVPLKDVFLLSIELLCLVAGLLTVFYSRVAIFLGQINQLIAIGFLLAVMAVCLEGQILRTAIMHTASRNGSTIQDLDALLRKDPFASKIHPMYRILLLSLLGLPLLLSIGYKTFVGGESTIVVHMGDGFFGFSSTPGKQRIGDGLSILSDVYVPFWIDPALNRTYGFNMYIAADNKTAMIVDSPYPSYLTAIQSSLSNGETVSLSATVNATVSEMVNLTEAERNSDDFWATVQNDFGHDRTTNGGNVEGANNALWAGMGGGFSTNFSIMYFSAWNTTRNETFESEAIRTEQTRRVARATWVISSSDIMLTEAELIENSTLANQTLLQSNAIGLQEMFSIFLGEYDWHNRAAAFDFPYPSPRNGELRYFQPVNTIPPLAATMAWARITSLDTIDRPQGIQSGSLRVQTGYSKAERNIVTIKTVPILRRLPLLALLLLINPLLSLACVVVKASFLYRSPIGDNFNTISLFAAARKSDLRTVKGASLTGELTRKVPVAFSIESNSLPGHGTEGRGGVEHVVLSLDQVDRRSGRIKRGTVYS